MSKDKNFIPNTVYANPDGEAYPSGINGRIDFSKISGSLSLPNLVEVQTDSYDWFLHQGIDEVLKEVIQIPNYANTLSIKYVSSRLEPPKYTPLQCKTGDLTYSSKLKATLRLEMKSTGEMKDAEVFMGEIPLMTDSGTFIVNGSERVIISQIVRSPGAYYSREQDRKQGIFLYYGEIIPSRGTWLQSESDTKGILSLRIDRQFKFPFQTLFRGIGIGEHDKKENETLKMLFGESESVLKTLEKDAEIKTPDAALLRIYAKLKPGEPSTAEGRVQFIKERFFDDKRYDLGRAGRFKYAQKLSIYNRLAGQTLAENLISGDGEILFPKGHKLTAEEVAKLKEDKVFESGAHVYHLKVNTDIDTYSDVNLVKVEIKDAKGKSLVRPIVGTDLNLDHAGEKGKPVKRITVSDMVAFFNYYVNLLEGIGTYDDIDHLGNRRIRSVGELLENQFRIGLSKMTKAVQQKMSISDPETATPQSLINIRPLTSAIREFFASGQLSQFMDQTNPLAELTNKRRISALGPGGLTRDRASMEVRDVHYTHYGRICPIESPEGQNIGLINNLCTYAKINEHGFIMTPYRKVYHVTGKDGVLHTLVSETETTYLSADDERGLYIAEANIALSAPRPLSDFTGKSNEMVKEIIADEVVVRHDEDNLEVSKSIVSYVDVSPKQIVSIAAACIPFLAHDDATRALMGANMQRQALPLLRPHAAYVGTGMEAKIAKDSGLAVVASKGGKVIYKDGSTIVIDDGEHERTYEKLKKNAADLQFAVKVKKGQLVAPGEVVVSVDGMACQVEAPGIVAFMDKTRVMIDEGGQDRIYSPLKKLAADLPTARKVSKGDHVLANQIVATPKGYAVQIEEEGIVDSVTDNAIKVVGHAYHLQKFDRSNGGTCINQEPIVELGEMVNGDQVIADGPAMVNGELALGQNVLVAYMTWNGYNYEDAVIMSEKMVKDDTFTSIHIEKYEIECRENKLGPEEITREIPNVGEEAKAFLDERGIIVPGAEVKEGDILVGKATPKSQEDPTPEEKLLQAIFAEKTKEKKDTSLRVPHGGAGIVHAVKVFSRKNKDPLPTGVDQVVRVYVVQKRKISEGDKMSGRHGNKGVISKILPVEDMPFLADGTPIDILLSPMGVPSRMNIGQILEVHLGLACRKLNMRVATPAFDGVSNKEVFDLMAKANISPDGKTVLYDGRTGEPFAERISVGVQYMIKLVHMVDDKLHARATGPYALVTQQPLGGKAQKGGQRFGEMEVWALEAYGAAHTLQEMMTIKSDDRVGRAKAYEAIIKGNPIPRSGMPEAFKVFTKELKGLCMSVKLFDGRGEIINMEDLAKQSLIEERRTNSAIHKDMAPQLPMGDSEVTQEHVAEEGLNPYAGDKALD